MSDSTNAHRIVVLGAGYTGMMCAVRLARRTRRTGVRITLVNPSERFTERLRMHQIATEQELATYRIPELIAGLGIDFVPGWATRIDLDRREVTVATARGDERLGYDTLVYAIGSVVDTSLVPGAATHAYTLDSARSALRLAGRLVDIPAGVVAVCGGGLTGIEAAAEIAERRPDLRVLLLTRGVPGSMMGEKARAYLDRTLDRLGVEVRAGVEISKVLPDGVELANGETVPADACLWTTGFIASPLAAASGLTVDAQNRIIVDATLRSVSHPSVYAIGDAAAITQDWGTIHGTCQSGIPSGAYAADTIARRLRGREPRPFRFGYLHQPVCLGREDAVIQFTHADDSPTRFYLRGRWATAYKEFVTSSPTTTYGMSRRFNIPIRSLSPRSGKLGRAQRS